MSDAPEPTPPTPAAAAATPAAAGGSSLTRLLAIILVVAAVGGAAYAVIYLNNQEQQPVDTAVQLKEYLRQQGRFLKMADAYKDEDKDLVADAPKDKFLNPDELTFTTVVLDDPKEAEKIWQPFLDHLAKTTGKKVKYLKEVEPAKDSTETKPAELRATDQQLDAVREGKLHITAFNTGLVPGAVNTAGFVPMFCPADKDGKFTYVMEVIVPANSPVQKVSDLKSSSPDKPAIAFVAMSSNSGAKAPLVIFKEEFNMLPGPAREYEFRISGEHSKSIKGVADGKTYAAACVAGDILARMTAPGKDGKPEVDPTKIRSIYSSKPFPPLCFGVPYNLEPGLRKKIEEAFATFKFEGNSVGERYKSSQGVKFAPVKYKEDWENVRSIDEKLTKLLDK